MGHLVSLLIDVDGGPMGFALVSLLEPTGFLQAAIIFYNPFAEDRCITEFFANGSMG